MWGCPSHVNQFLQHFVLKRIGRSVLQPRGKTVTDKNNFDLLRLLFASAVGLVHASDLSGFQQLEWIAASLSSVVAVKAFFVISGFLIFMSFERSTSLMSYARKRIQRIYPAYLTVILLCAIGLSAVSSSSLSEYFSFSWLRYVAGNLVFLNFLQPTLSGVFGSNIVPTVNGVLWTLKIEVLFYFSVPLLVFLIRQFAPFAVLAFIYILSVAYGSLLTWVASQTGSSMYLELARQLPGQLSYFTAGAFFYYFLPLFQRRRFYFLTGAVLVLIVNRFFSLPLLEPFALATVVVFFGLLCYVGNIGKFGDFSYGIYILHFPIIQLCCMLAGLTKAPGIFFLPS